MSPTPLGLNADKMILVAAAVSLCALAVLSVAHSPWMLAVLAPLPIIWYLSQRQAHAASAGTAQLRLALNAILTQHDAATSRLQLVPVPTE